MPNETPRLEMEAITAALTGVGNALSAASIFGADHFRARAAIEETLRGLVPLLAARPRLALHLSAGRLQLDGIRMDGRDRPQIRALQHRLEALHSNGFILQRGLTADDLQRLIARIATHREDGFDETLKTSPIPHVLGGQWIWQSGAGGAKPGAPPTPAATEPRRRPPPAPRPDGGILQLDAEGGAAAANEDPRDRALLACLLDESTAPDPAARAALAERARAPEQLAALLVRAALARGATEGPDVEQRLTTYLRRTIALLRDLPGGAGAADFRQLLPVIENALVRQLKDVAGLADVSPPRLAQSLATLSVEWELDILAGEFRDLRERMAECEKRLFKRTLANGPLPIEAALRRAGVSVEEWHALLKRFAEYATRR